MSLEFVNQIKFGKNSIFMFLQVTKNANQTNAPQTRRKVVLGAFFYFHFILYPSLCLYYTFIIESHCSSDSK